MIVCPECECKMYCPCDSCKKSREKRNERNVKLQICINRTQDSFDIKCPDCGFTKSANWYFDYDWEKAKKQEEKEIKQ